MHLKQSGFVCIFAVFDIYDMSIKLKIRTPSRASLATGVAIWMWHFLPQNLIYNILSKSHKHKQHWFYLFPCFLVRKTILAYTWESIFNMIDLIKG